MIQENQYLVSKARSSIGQILAFSLLISMLSHGMFFKYEWLILGIILAGYTLIKIPELDLETFNHTDLLLAGLIALSLLGIFHPVRLSEGIFEAMHWGIFWLVYRLSRQISQAPAIVTGVIKKLHLIAFLFAISGWVPIAGEIWLAPGLPEAGRLSSWFGYPNAAAAFLGAVLLLNPKHLLITICLGISLVSTGSRGGIGLFVIILVLRELGCVLFNFPRRERFFKLRERFLPVFLKILGLSIFLLGGLLLIKFFYEPALTHLWSWGFSSTSWYERLHYYRDGLKLAVEAYGFPRAGGWWAFPEVQQISYWSADPHSSIIRILLNQGILGVVLFAVWGYLVLKQEVQTMHFQDDYQRREALNRLSVVLFLAFHSFIDADFSFGALGILFWVIVGIMTRSNYFAKSHIRQVKTLRFRR
ncbi:MAG: O-antigen ligase domain-containing protein, partial [Desulfitobacterium hafniense]|nr:O-antigen ligase domain-containing protein [Desulfitobacterium hafniense]